jgi:hypothetical protein
LAYEIAKAVLPRTKLLSSDALADSRLSVEGEIDWA